MSKSILLIDDDEDALLSLSRALSSRLGETAVHAASSADRALSLFAESRPHAVVLDLCLEPSVGVDSGKELLKELLTRDPSVRVLILTGHSDTQNGIACVEMGATSFLGKPADLAHLKALLVDAMQQCELRRELAVAQAAETTDVLKPLVGSSKLMQSVRGQIEFLSSNKQSVLITGETGTGKGLCAKLIHSLSTRKGNLFIRYQPNFTAAEMVNSDLFGHEKGAFTGAEKERAGLLLEAHQGTLFLDEVDELPAQTQVALLGVFQEKLFRPLGGNNELASDFRLLTACNKPIEESVASGKVRVDFYHRIAHAEIALPPLRERPEDISELAFHFLQLTAAREDVPVLHISDEVLSSLSEHRWPGNVREFQATIESATYRAHYRGSTKIIATDLPNRQTEVRTTGEVSSLNEQVKVFRKEIVTKALRSHKDNQVHAARALGINRSTLKRILDE